MLIMMEEIAEQQTSLNGLSAPTTHFSLVMEYAMTISKIIQSAIMMEEIAVITFHGEIRFAMDLITLS